MKIKLKNKLAILYLSIGLFLIQRQSISAQEISKTKVTGTKSSGSPNQYLSIDRLNPGQNLVIQVQSNGCFHQSKLLLIVNRKSNGYFVSFKMKGKIEGIKVHKTYRKTKVSESQLNAVRDFEKWLRLVSAETYNCTTVDNYTLSIGSSKANFRVDDCRESGMNDLIVALFQKHSP